MKIQPHLIDSLDFSSISDIFNIPASKKVIDITNCTSINSVLDFLTSNAEKLPKTIFILTFNINEPKIWTFERQKLQILSETLNKSETERTFVFQSKFRTAKFLCKIKNQPLLTKIELSRNLHEDEFTNSLITNELIFKAVVMSRVEAGICGVYDYSFSSIILDINRHFLGLKLIDYALINFDSISLRFLQLFGIDLSITNKNGDRPLETAVKCGNFCGFLELLGGNFEVLTLLHQPTGFNLLMLAAENGNPEILQYLLELDIFDVNFCVNEKTALNLAINEKKFEAVAVLLEHDAKYGEDFMDNFTEDVKELHNLVATQGQGHKNEEEIKKIFQKYPKTRNFFDSNGQSALKTAVISAIEEDIEECSSRSGQSGQNCSNFIEFLLINGLRMGKIEEFPEILTSKSDNLAENLIYCDYIHRIISNIIFKCDDDHLKSHNNNSLDSTDHSEGSEESVNKMFNRDDEDKAQLSKQNCNKMLFDALKLLNNIPETKILLEIFGVYENVKIILNLNNLTLEIKENCSNMSIDHCLRDKSDSSCSKLTNFSNIFPTMSPIFGKLDDFARSFIEKIFNFIIIKIANNNLNQNKDNLIAKLKNYLVLLKTSTKLAKFNKLSKFYESISNMSHKFAWKNIKKFQDLSILDQKPDHCILSPQILITNSKILTLIQIFQEKSENFLIFVEFVDFCDESYQNEVKEMLKFAHLVVSVNNSDKIDEKLNFEVMKNFYDRILFVFENNEFANLDKLLRNCFKFSDSHFLRISHNFSDFDKKTKDFLLEKQVDLQGKLVKLSEIIKSSNCPTLDDIPLNLLSDDSKILKIGQKLENRGNFYYDRRFIDTIWAQISEIKDQYLHLDPIKCFGDLHEQKIILLCDEPGMGKTTTLKQLQFKFKEIFPSNWIIYVDLKRHGSIYEDFKNVQIWNYQNFTEFFTKIQNLTEFESKIFHQLLLTEKVIFLIDGVDEITQKHKDFIINFTKDLYRITNCHLWIAMRPHCKSEYSGNFHICSYHLEPIDASKFLETLIKSQKMTNNEKNNARKYVENLKKCHKSFNNPLFISIVFDVYDQFEESVGIYMMYETYVLKKFTFVVQNEEENSEILLKNSEKLKNSEILLENSEILLKNSEIILKNSKNIPKLFKDITELKFARKIFQNHQKVAIYKFITTIPNNTNFSNLEILKEPPTEDEIIYYLKYKVINAINTIEQIFFIHKTFYEFFVASFIIEMFLERPEGGMGCEQYKMCELLFVKVFMDSGYQVIGRFIESYIEDNEERIFNCENSNLREILRKNKFFGNEMKIVENQTNFFDGNLFHLITSKFFYFSKFVLKIFENENEMSEIFIKVGEKSQTIFYKIVNFSHSSPDILEYLNFFAENFDGIQRKNIFEYFLYYQSENCVKKSRIFVIIFTRLNENDLEKFFEILGNIFTENELEFHLNNDDNLNIFNIIIKNIKFFEVSAKKLEFFFNFSKNFLKDDKKISILDETFENFNFLSQNEQNFDDVESLIKEIISNLKKDEILSFLKLENGKNAKKILKFVSSKICHNFYQFLITQLDIHLTKNEFRDFIESEPNLIIDFFNACYNFNEEKVIIFWKFATFNLSRKKLREFLTFKPENSKFSTFHFAISYFVFNFEEFFTNLEIKNLLSAKNSQNETILFEIYPKNKLNDSAGNLLRQIFKKGELKFFLNHRNYLGYSAFNPGGKRTCFDFKIPKNLSSFIEMNFRQNELFEDIKSNERTCQII